MCDNPIRRRRAPLAGGFADLLDCLTFWSRIDAGGGARPFDLPQRPLSEAVRMLPVAAVIIAVPAALVLVLAALLGLPPLASATAALAALAIVTGGLHEDGLADVADGFWGGRDRERRLAIMRDSRIGAYGTLALVFASLARIVLVAEVVVRAGPLAGAAVLIATAVAARAASLWPWAALAAARTDGVAHGAGPPGRPALFTAGSIALALVAALVLPVAPAAVVLAPAAAVLAGWAVARIAERKIGGHTGDVIGAAEQLAEIAFLAGIVMCL